MKTTKSIRRQLARTAGGQDLWPRKSVSHTLMGVGGSHEWHKEFIRRRLGHDALAVPPKGSLP